MTIAHGHPWPMLQLKTVQPSRLIIDLERKLIGHLCKPTAGSFSKLLRPSTGCIGIGAASGDIHGRSLLEGHAGAMGPAALGTTKVFTAAPPWRYSSAAPLQLICGFTRGLLVTLHGQHVRSNESLHYCVVSDVIGMPGRCPASART